MARNRRSAKQAGTSFETSIANYLNQHVDDRIERRRLTGSKDRGDIAGVRHMGQKVTIECKNCARPELALWMSEAEAARGNDDALSTAIIHKRTGRTDPAVQWVTMTVQDYAALLTGQRPTDTPDSEDARRRAAQAAWDATA